MAVEDLLVLPARLAVAATRATLGLGALTDPGGAGALLRRLATTLGDALDRWRPAAAVEG